MLTLSLYQLLARIYSKLKLVPLTKNRAYLELQAQGYSGVLALKHCSEVLALGAEQAISMRRSKCL